MRSGTTAAPLQTSKLVASSVEDLEQMNTSDVSSIKNLKD